MFGWFKKRSLKEHLRDQKKIKIKGISFTLRKIDPLDHAKGMKVMRAQFDTLRIAKGEIELTEGQIKKMKEHYRDVFMSSVVSPKLSVKDESDSTCVDEIFSDPELSERLYLEIMLHTYGKKKLMSRYSTAIESLNLTSSQKDTEFCQAT